MLGDIVTDDNWSGYSGNHIDSDDDDDDDNNLIIS